MTHLLVVGATGGIGSRVVAAAQRRELRVTALVRDAQRAEGLLPGVELAEGDLEQPAGLRAAVKDVDAIVFAHGSHGAPDRARRVDYGGVANVLHALDGRTPRVALMTSIYVARRENPMSGAPCTIVRPSWFDSVGPGDERLVLEQGDTGDGGIGRDQLAEVLVRSVLTDTAVGRTFELFAKAGAPPTDWDGLFGALTPDAGDALDGARDPEQPALDDEPAVVREDIARLTAA